MDWKILFGVWMLAIVQVQAQDPDFIAWTTSYIERSNLVYDVTFKAVLYSPTGKVSRRGNCVLKLDLDENENFKVLVSPIIVSKPAVIKGTAFVEYEDSLIVKMRIQRSNPTAYAELSGQLHFCLHWGDGIDYVQDTEVRIFKNSPKQRKVLVGYDEKDCILEIK